MFAYKMNPEIYTTDNYKMNDCVIVEVQRYTEMKRCWNYSFYRRINKDGKELYSFEMSS